jgi:hypothetical protein
MAALLVLAAGVSAVAATPQCLRSDEAVADQAIRFQTEVMVISDTCGAQTYTRFARRNHLALAQYQEQIIERFRRSGSSHAEARFDAYITHLANEVSLRVGARPVAIMCRDAQGLLATADTLQGEKFRHFVAERAAMRGNRRLCRN